MTTLAADPGAPPSFRRLFALVRATMPALRTGWLSRSGRYYAWSIAVFYAGVAAFATVCGETISAFSVVTLSLTWISWAAGLVACAAARDLEAEERQAGLDWLLRLRAVPRAQREPVRLLSTMAVVAVAVLAPALLVTFAALVLAPSARSLLALLPLTVLVLGYAVLYGVAFGAVARWSAALSKRHARVVFALVVFGPVLANAAIGPTPSLPSAFEWLLERIRELGSVA